MTGKKAVGFTGGFFRGLEDQKLLPAIQRQTVRIDLVAQAEGSRNNETLAGRQSRTIPYHEDSCMNEVNPPFTQLPPVQNQHPGSKM